MVKPTHVSVAAEASPVGQKQEGGNWISGLEGAVHCVALELEHDLVIIRRVAEGVATITCRKGIITRSKDLVSVACAEVGVV
eukprot:164452-Pelagomonas_calceolata.AAC.1